MNVLKCKYVLHEQRGEETCVPKVERLCAGDMIRNRCSLTLIWCDLM